LLATIHRQTHEKTGRFSMSKLPQLTMSPSDELLALLRAMSVADELCEKFPNADKDALIRILLGEQA
jgi:hypothetical protein